MGWSLFTRTDPPSTWSCGSSTKTSLPAGWGLPRVVWTSSRMQKVKKDSLGTKGLTMAKTLEQARQDRVRGQNETLQALFDLGKDVNNFPEPELSPAARQALTEGQLKAMRAREAEARAQD